MLPRSYGSDRGVERSARPSPATVRLRQSARDTAGRRRARRRADPAEHEHVGVPGRVIDDQVGHVRDDAIDLGLPGGNHELVIVGRIADVAGLVGLFDAADAVKQAGQASPEGEGNWAKSTFEDLVQYNDGFKTNLIGTPQQIAERIVALKAVGVDLILSGFLHFQEEVAYFGEKVLPLVRELVGCASLELAADYATVDRKSVV